MEKEIKQEDPYLVALKETGECRIPIGADDQENIPFVQLLDQVREYAEGLVEQIDTKVISRCSWTEELGYHYLIQTEERFS